MRYRSLLFCACTTQKVLFVGNIFFVAFRYGPVIHETFNGNSTIKDEVCGRLVDRNEVSTKYVCDPISRPSRRETHTKFMKRGRVL